MSSRQTELQLGRRRFLGMAASALLGTTVLAACSSPPAATPAASTPASSASTGAAPTATAGTAASVATVAPAATASGQSNEAITLTWDTFRGGGTTWPQMMVDTYQKMFPNRKIILRPIPVPNAQAEAYPKMYAMYAAGTLGDNFAFDPSHWEFYRAVPQGLLLAVDDLVAQDKLDLTPWFNAFIDMQHYKGKMWGLPVGAGPARMACTSTRSRCTRSGYPLRIKTAPTGRWTRSASTRTSSTRRPATRSIAMVSTSPGRRRSDDCRPSVDQRHPLRRRNKDAVHRSQGEPALQWISDVCQPDKVDSLPGTIPSGQDNALFGFRARLAFYRAARSA